MSKIFALKKWLTLEDAAKRLTTSLQEEVTVRDILQLSLEQEISLSWNIRFKYLREVAPYTRLMGFGFTKEEQCMQDPPDKKLDPKAYEIFLIKKEMFSSKNIAFNFEPQSYPFKAEGIYELDLTIPIIKEFIHSLISKENSDIRTLEGFLVKTKEGILYQRVDILPPRENEKVYDNLDQRAYPSDDLPKYGDLTIRKADIDKLEDRLLNTNAQNNNIRTPEESLIEALGLMAILLSKKIPTLKSGSKPNASQIVEAIEREAGLMGHEIDKISNLRKDLSYAVKIFRP